MESKIAEYIHLLSQPIAVIKSDSAPAGAIQFKEGTWNCVIAMLSAASLGKTAALSEETVGCMGGKVGTGFKSFVSGTIEYFLSTGGKGPKEGEFYKKSPDLASDYINSIPHTDAQNYLLLVPLDKVEETDRVSSVIFLVNADQLSALVTLANYDKTTQENVKVKFGSGCVQAILTSLCDEERDTDVCTIGLTDPSARNIIDKNLLSFSIPYHRFLEMEENAPESFLTKATWQKIANRIE